MKAIDYKKLKRLGKIALGCLVIRLVVYLFPGDFEGVIFDVLWIPLFFFLLALLFYGIEYFLDRLIRKIKG